MATDGGQIRTRSRIYAEQNHSMTVTSSDLLNYNNVLIASGPKELKKLETNGRPGILITDANGNAQFFPVPEGVAGYNKLLSTDGNGNLIWINR